MPMRSSGQRERVVPVAADLEVLDGGEVRRRHGEAGVGGRGAGEQALLQRVRDVARLLVEPARARARCAACSAAARSSARSSGGSGRAPAKATQSAPPDGSGTRANAGRSPSTPSSKRGARRRLEVGRDGVAVAREDLGGPAVLARRRQARPVGAEGAGERVDDRAGDRRRVGRGGHRRGQALQRVGALARGLLAVARDAQLALVALALRRVEDRRADEQRLAVRRPS